MLCKKIENGYVTSDIRIASALLAQGFKFKGVQYANPLEVPGLALTGQDGREIVERDFKKATEKVRDFGFEITGIYLPREKGYKVFMIEGDPDKIEAAVLAYHNGQCRVDAKAFSDHHRNLLSLIKDHP